MNDWEHTPNYKKRYPPTFTQLVEVVAQPRPLGAALAEHPSVQQRILLFGEDC